MHLNVQEEGKRVFLHFATFKMMCRGPLGRIPEAKIGPSEGQIRAKRGPKGGSNLPIPGAKTEGIQDQRAKAPKERVPISPKSSSSR